MPFHCSICEEESSRICVYCTKDTCGNHLCEKCSRCSDCCECDVPLEGRPATVRSELYGRPPEPEPTPHPYPGPEPDPAPDPESISLSPGQM